MVVDPPSTAGTGSPRGPQTSDEQAVPEDPVCSPGGSQSLSALRDRETRLSRVLLDNLESAVNAIETLRPRHPKKCSRRLKELVQRLTSLEDDDTTSRKQGDNTDQPTSPQQHRRRKSSVSYLYNDDGVLHESSAAGRRRSSALLTRLSPEVTSRSPSPDVTARSPEVQSRATTGGDNIFLPPTKNGGPPDNRLKSPSYGRGGELKEEEPKLASAGSWGRGRASAVARSLSPRSLSKGAVVVPVERPLEEDEMASSSDGVRRVNDMRRVRLELSARFKELDVENRGMIDEATFVRALVEAGVDARDAGNLFQATDENGDDSMDETEFITLIESNDSRLNGIWGTEVSKDAHQHFEKGRRFMLMLSPHDPLRVAWDLTTAVLLAYVAIVEPVRLSFGFVTRTGEASFVRNADSFLDVFFVLDILLNFRTGYIPAGTTRVELNPYKAASYYARNWFVLDVVSSLPPLFKVLALGVDALGGGGDDLELSDALRAAKIVKLSRLLKISKMLRVAKLMRFSTASWDSPVGEFMEDFFFSSKSKAARKCFTVLLVFGVIAHYLACGLRLVGTRYLRRFAPDPLRPDRDATEWPVVAQYMASLYWSVTTMTTVGYGDVIPVTNAERGFAMIAMLIGASTYGFVVASATSIVTASDAQQSSYYEKMDRVHSWLEYHSMPLEIRRMVRVYYRSYFQQRTAFDERLMIADLNPEIQQKVADHMLPSCIRHNALFSNLPKGALSRLVAIVHLMHLGPNDLIVEEAEPCSSMFVLYTGKVLLERSSGVKENDHVHPGASFGEVGILGLAARSKVTATAMVTSKVYLLPQDEFLEAFGRLPEVLNEMRYLVLLRDDMDVPTDRRPDLLQKAIRALEH